MLTVRDSLVLNLLLYSLIGLSVIGLTFIITLARFMWIWKPRILVGGGNFVACCVWWLTVWTLELCLLTKQSHHKRSVLQILSTTSIYLVILDLFSSSTKFFRQFYTPYMPVVSVYGECDTNVHVSKNTSDWPCTCL